MTHNQDKVIGTGSIILIILMALAVPVAGWRYFNGLGSITNLSDAYPWGFWISFDLFCGVALAAGAFVVAAVVDIFGGKTMKPLLRPAILTGFLGYILVGTALMVDLGQYHRIWYLTWSWNLHSPLFEVGWCVMMYLTVLALEFAPVVLEKFKLEVPLKILKRVSIVLIIAGITLSTMHQSSLGTMLLIMQDKLHPLWHTQILPILFLNTAIAVGIAMVIFESTITMKVFGRPAETAAQGKLAKGLPWVLGIYFIIRIADIAFNGRIGLIFDGSRESLWFWIEMIIGVIIPFFYFLSSKVRSSTPAMFKGALMVMAGVMFNRFIVSWLGIRFPEGSSYVPHIMEIMISAGVVSGGIMAFYLLSRFFPVLSEEH